MCKKKDCVEYLTKFSGSYINKEAIYAMNGDGKYWEYESKRYCKSYGNTRLTWKVIALII